MVNAQDKGFMKKLIGFVLTCFLITSCMNFDSQRIQPTRSNYNEALQYGDKYQLLLNIVRFRYNDLPYFFSVNNIIAQINYSNTFTGSVNNTWTPPPVNFATSGSDSVTVGEAPTITYTPLQGDAFIKKMLTPVDLRVMFMMVHSTAVDLNRLFRLFVLQIGPFENTTSDSVFARDDKSLNLEFMRMAKIMSHLAKHRQLILQADSIDGKFSVKMTLKSFNGFPPKKQAVLKKLGFSEQNLSVWIMQEKTVAVKQPTQLPLPLSSEDSVTHGVLKGVSRLPAIPSKFKEAHEKPKKIIILQTKPLFTVLTFLSKGVSTPANEQNRIMVGTRLPNQKYLNWQYYVADIFDVHACVSRPKNAFLMVRYRDKWFYIRDDDVSTKATFYIVSILMNLYEGNVQNGLTPFYSILT